MPEYIPERELAAFLGQQEQSALGRAMAESIPGTAEFAAGRRGRGRLENIASVLGSAGGGSSSMALSGRVQAGPIYGELARLTGEALRSIPAALRRQLTGTAGRRIKISESPEAQALGRYNFPIYGRGGRSIEEIKIQADLLPEGVKRRVLQHELQHAQDEYLMPGENRLLFPVVEAAPGQSRALYDKGYSAADIAHEIVPHAVETTMKPRYYLSEGEARVREALVKARRQEAKELQRNYKESARRRAKAYDRPVY